MVGDFDLYSCAQLPTQTTDSYYKMFTSTVGTIYTNRSQAGLHPVVYPGHLNVKRAKELVKASTAIKDMQLDDAIDLEERGIAAARESATAEYLAYLFLFLVDSKRCTGRL